MNISLNKTLLVDCLSLEKSSLGLIINQMLDPDIFDLQINKTELISLINDLILEGSIQVENRKIFYKRSKNKKTALLKTNDILALTKKGGLLWERQFRPKWLKYVSICVLYNDVGNTEVSLTSCNQDHLLSIKNSIAIESTSIEDHILTYWHPTYWKILKNAYTSKIIFNGDIMESINELIPIDFFKPWKLNQPCLGYGGASNK